MSTLKDTTMNYTMSTNHELPEIFSDPVAYLAAHGIEATLVDEPALSAAA